MNIARMIGAGPLIVIDTDVEGAQRSKPSYSFFMSSNVQMLTPLSLLFHKYLDGHQGLRHIESQNRMPLLAVLHHHLLINNENADSSVRAFLLLQIDVSGLPLHV